MSPYSIPIDSKLAKESMATILHNTPDLVKYTEIEIPRIKDLTSDGNKKGMIYNIA